MVKAHVSVRYITSSLHFMPYVILNMSSNPLYRNCYPFYPINLPLFLFSKTRKPIHAHFTLILLSFYAHFTNQKVMERNLDVCDKMTIVQTRRGWCQELMGCQARTEFKVSWRMR
jgi:hypothetical protein